MKRFSFRLQKLLNLEGQREQQAKLIIYSLVNNLRGQESILGFLQDSLYENQKKLGGKENVSTNSQKLMLCQNYIIALNDRIAQQSKLINEAAVKIEKSRNEMLAIRKDRKILEKLKDRDRDEHSSLMMKAETKELDDISNCRQFMKNCN
ncbi:MAG: flagellar export protein FliJ [Candidatus Anammoxibacter sp.]